MLVVTTDAARMQTMIEAADKLRVPRSAGSSVFLFATFDDLGDADPLECNWVDGADRHAALI